MSRYSALNRVVPADTAYSTTPKRVTDNVQLGGGHFQELLHEENDPDASFHGHPRDQYRPCGQPAGLVVLAGREANGAVWIS